MPTGEQSEQVAELSAAVDELWNRCAGQSYEDLPEDAIRMARLGLLDWFGCALAGSQTRLVEILRAERRDPGPCSVLGTTARTGHLSAAMLNGAAGHALDFDDTSPLMHGHPSAPLLPALVAIGEQIDASSADLLAAYVVGVEVEARIGQAIGATQYNAGWHQTATVGVIGAAAAASHLLGLDDRREARLLHDRAQFGAAIGIASSCASGVKANFGSMTKPLHAGFAAERGVLAAWLARRGFTANEAALDGPQGFLAAASGGHFERLSPAPSHDWAILRTMFKVHASCHLTHAAIEATRSLLASSVRAADVTRVEVAVNSAVLDVCAIEDPVTGLEAKFSLRGTQALALAGVDTAMVESFDDATIRRPDVQALFPLIDIRPDPDLALSAARVSIHSAGGVNEAVVDVASLTPDPVDLAASLHSKFASLATPVLGQRGTQELSDLIATAGKGVPVRAITRAEVPEPW